MLEQMLTTAKTLQTEGTHSLYPFQKGLIISCQSLRKLYDLVKSKYNVTYILTYRLNQDVLEHYFDSIRQMGISHQHPSPLQFKYRIRSFLVGKSCDLVGRNHSIEGENNDTSLTETSFSGDTLCHHHSENDLESELMVSSM